MAKISPMEDKLIENDIIPAVMHWSLEARDDGYKMQLLHMDSDSVFKCKEFKDWLATININTHYAPPGQHWANGLVERFIQTVGNNAQAMLDASGLPIKFWFFSLAHAVDLHNKFLTKRLQKQDSYKGKSAYDIVNKGKFRKKLPVFGQLVIARNSDPNSLLKWESRGRECIFLCTDWKSHTAFHALHKATKKIITIGDYQIIPNLYGWNIKPIVDDANLLVLGRFDAIMSNESEESTY